MKYALRRDGNIGIIEEMFRKRGVRVHPTNSAWDLTVQYAGITMLVEVKDGRKTPGNRPLTKAQKKLHEEFCIRIVTDEASVVSAVETLKNWQRFIQQGFTAHGRGANL